MKRSSKLIFFGTEDFSAASLEALIRAGWNFQAVVTKPDYKKGRGQLISKPRVKTIATQAGIEVWQPDALADIKDQLAAGRPDLGILVAYGKLIPKDVVDLFPKGIVNLHPSLLPRYRGPAPIEFAILNGDKETGISLMQLVAKMDAGPVYTRQSIKLDGTEDRLSLSKTLSIKGAEALAHSLETVLDGSLKARDQDDSQATYTRLLTKADGLVDWQKPAEVLEREVRAFLGYPRSRAKLDGQEVIITTARVADSASDGALVMACGHGYLEIEELVAPSGKTMSGADYLRGYGA